MKRNDTFRTTGQQKNKVKTPKVTLQPDQLEFVLQLLRTPILGINATPGAYVENEVKREIRQKILYNQGV